MKDEEDVKESDNVADSDREAERGRARLLDEEDRQDGQVGGVGIRKFSDLSGKIFRFVREEEDNDYNKKEEEDEDAKDKYVV